MAQPRTAWRLSDILQANEATVKVRLAWELKLHLLERIAKILSDLHGKRLTYGTNALSSDRVIVFDETRFGLEGLPEYPQESGRNQRSHDVLRWGIIALQVYTGKPITKEAQPNLYALLDARGRPALKKNRQSQARASMERRKSASAGGNLREDRSGDGREGEGEQKPRLKVKRGSMVSYVDMVREAAATMFTSVRSSFVGEDNVQLELGVEQELNNLLPMDLDLDEGSQLEGEGGDGGEEKGSHAPKPEWLMKLEELIYDSILHHPRPESNAIRTGLVNLMEDFEAKKASVNEHPSHAVYYTDFQPQDLVTNAKPSDGGSIKMYDSGDTQGSSWDTNSVYSDDLTHVPEHHAKRQLGRPKLPEISVAKTKHGTTGSGSGWKIGDEEDDLRREELLEEKGEEEEVEGKMRRASMAVEVVKEEAQKQRKPSVPLLAVEELETKFDEQVRLDRDQIIALLNKARVLLTQEENIIEVEAPVAVVGDLHGQYYDLRNLMDLIKQQSSTADNSKVLFLGDYVDRGKWSCETFFYLLRLKAAKPTEVHLLRGNHESDSTAAAYGFRNEVDRKYGRDVYHRCLEVFKALPLACLVKVKDTKPFIAMHGGISKNVRTLGNIKEINRFVEPPVNGTFCDLLWSDPVSNDFLKQHKEITLDFENIEYYDNPVRGCAQTFGYKALRRFLDENNLSGLIRAHEAKEEGFQFQFNELGKGEHVVATVFSAPNYMKTHGNKGAFLMVHAETGTAGAGGSKEKEAEALLTKSTSTAGSGSGPVSLLEPYSFKEVPNPPVRNTGDETFSLLQDVEQYCPYMSRDVEDFYNYTLDMLDYFGSAEDDEEFSWMRKARTKAWGRNQRQDSAASVYSSKISSTHSISAHSTFSMRSHRSLQSLSSVNSEAMKQNNLKGTVKKDKEKKEPAPQQHKRLQNMDEIHPLVLRQRLNNTSQELDTAYDVKRNATSSASATVEPARDLKVGAVTFSPKERQVIQFVFFTIDRFDSGKVGFEEIQAWASEEGLVIKEDDAKRCVSAIDYDGDGKIGISDFFIYASKLKETWQMEHERLNQWKSVDDDNYSDFMSSDDDESY